MPVLLAITIGLLATAGLYRLLGPSRIDALVGLILLGQAANLVLFASGGLRHNAPALIEKGMAVPTDPLPQALVLTAIVIGFGIIAFLLTLVLRSSDK
ncbi:sodium:proton antiporter [Haloferula sp. A504]|jgi:multisubunit Na+/H+ antiporter MnhC subunit|uniref:sodium:proton antiporter n=1 Tax=Haloferula sp. A504 TaxID=3373601 RepID=UPI0031C3A8D6|nr:NADH-quinone oxidoreductase subunit K [Verrucomicrobiaceae bacterium E54]